jgi:hypothetical protein
MTSNKTLQEIDVEVDLPVNPRLRYLSEEVRAFLRKHRIAVTCPAANPITGQAKLLKFTGSSAALEGFKHKFLSCEDPHTYSLCYR